MVIGQYPGGTAAATGGEGVPAARSVAGRSITRTSTRPVRFEGVRTPVSSGTGPAVSQRGCVASAWDRWLSVDQLGQVGDDQVGAVVAQRLGLTDTVDANDQTELPVASSFDTG